ncbi:MAG: glycyl radical protein [Caldiserica bacterium]|jgi:formate C-acetyltransferase|nr:glycyl radical protein [Caldisericota bacterium]MDH7562320.1 glycyl radical protein [Caldisericota bacterium]
MRERVKRLREESLNTQPWLSQERALLITKYYRDLAEPHLSAPMKRALAFKYLMENKEIFIGEGELIVGERGPSPRSSYTYPEICCHSLEDLEILNSRPKIAYRVSDEMKKVYREEIIPFWKGKAMRDILFSRMSQEWRNAYEAGIFTEFMEQRAPGHTVLDDKIYRKGLRDLQAEIQVSLASLDYFNDPEAYRKSEELKAMHIACEAVINFAHRHANKALELAEKETDPRRKSELKRIAEVCRRVPAYAPRDFWEALQAYWFVHLGVVTELNTWDSFCPGHLDQHLYPFFKKDLEEGRLTEEDAKELLECLWVKFNNQPAPPKVGVTGQESATYTDFCNINLGGLKADGSDGVNDLTYLILDVIDEMRLVQPSSNIQLSRKSPEKFLLRACEIIRKGWGQPSVFNADMVVMELLRQGKRIEDARQGGTSGCVETGAFGKEAYILSGYFNLVKVLEITLNNGMDPLTGKVIGLRTGDPEKFQSYDDLWNAFSKQLEYFIDIKIRGGNIIERLFAEHIPAPFLSTLIDDCIKKGKDYHDGGPRYNTTYIMGTGVGTLTDSLSALKFHVFTQKNFSMREILEALRTNFESNPQLRQTLWEKTPRYGNDDPFADQILEDWFNLFFNLVAGRPNTRGGNWYINFLSTTVHVYFGSMVGATPDGRKALQPLSDGISPTQGTDRKGPTAVIKSASRMDHARTGGTLLNMKFTPQVLEGENLKKLAQLIRAYFALGGHHVQFNVVNAETLRAAQANPEAYRDLIVRVAGYSDYFCDLNKALQDEIIARTEHEI